VLVVFAFHNNNKTSGENDSFSLRSKIPGNPMTASIEFAKNHKPLENTYE